MYKHTILITLLMCMMAVCHADSELKFIVLDSAGKPVNEAIVALYDGKPVAMASNAVAEIAQKDKQFVPHVTVAQTGTAIQFPNQDKVRHHVYSFSPAKKFEIKLYSGLPAAPVKFDQPGLVTLGCNIHDNMLGYVYIVDTPLFAQTDAAGQATLKVSDAEYTYRIWHAGEAKPALEQKIRVSGAYTIKLTLPPSTAAGI